MEDSPKLNKYGLVLFSVFTLLAIVSITLYPVFLDYRPFIIYLSIALFAMYVISMMSGRHINNKVNLKGNSTDKHTITESRKKQWFYFVVLFAVSILVDFCCFLLAQQSPYQNTMDFRQFKILLIYNVFIMGMPFVMTMFRTRTSFLIILSSAIILEKVSAELAYHNLGGIYSATFYLAIWLNIIPMLLYAFKLRNTAIVAVFTLVLLLVPYQLYLGYQYIQLQNEAQSIVDYVTQEKYQTGKFPEDISGYTFRKAYLKEHFHYRRSKGHQTDDIVFSFHYYIGTPNPA